MDETETSQLIYNWNGTSKVGTPIQLDDETLRDGLQSPSVHNPSIDDKIRLITLMDDLGVDTADIGLPGSSPRAREDIETLCQVMAEMHIQPNVACRTLVSDIEPAAEIQQRIGRPLEVCTFIGSSRIRGFVEDWDLNHLLELVLGAVSFCVQQNLPVMFVTEDTTRAHPETLEKLYSTAIAAGADRICVCDTCGQATPIGVRQLMRHITRIVKNSGREVGIDWHGHNDRGLGLINALAAIEGGATRIHGTALGVGERAGNTAMDQLLVNLYLEGYVTRDLTQLKDYIETAAVALEVPIPHNYPVFGKDAFETSTGVHAAAVIKALRRTENGVWLADRVYSGVPASSFGREQTIMVGPMSGRSNVIWVLKQAGATITDERVVRILDHAKLTPRQLTIEEVLAVTY